MKKRIGFYGLCLVILGFFVGGIVSVEALEQRTSIQSPSKAVVPNVTGIPSDLALQILQVAGFSGKIKRGSSRSLTVESQEPQAGTLVAANSTIMLGVGGATVKKSRSEQTSVPVLVPETKQPEQTVYTQRVPEQNSPSLGLNIVTQQAGMKPIMVWYPQRFLSGATNAKTQNLQRILRNQPNGSGVPIIMAPTQGWQDGWTQ